MTETELEQEYALLKEIEDQVEHWALVVEDTTRSTAELAVAAAHLSYYRQIASRKRTRIALLRRQQGDNP